MAVRFTERTKPTKGGILRQLLGLGVDLVASGAQSVSSAAHAASAGEVLHKPCDVCTKPSAPVAPAGGTL